MSEEPENNEQDEKKPAVVKGDSPPGDVPIPALLKIAGASGAGAAVGTALALLLLGN